MTNAPTDLLGFRSSVMSRTGITDASAVGIVGDAAHAASGGYHEGKTDLTNAGVFGTDYSTRLTRDRNGCTESASAMDIGYAWPRGGNAAWLRFNNWLVTELHAGRPELAAVRAVNYSPNGSTKLRTDRESGWSVVSSTDSVDIHTHIEWYRDTEGKRQTCLDRLAVLIEASVNNTNPEGSPMADTDIPDTWHSAKGADNWGRAAVTGQPASYYPGETTSGPVPTTNALHQKLDTISTNVAALVAAPSATLSVSQDMLNAAVAANAQTIADLVAANLAARLES